MRIRVLPLLTDERTPGYACRTGPLAKVKQRERTETARASAKILQKRPGGGLHCRSLDRFGLGHRLALVVAQQRFHGRAPDGASSSRCTGSPVLWRPATRVYYPLSQR